MSINQVHITGSGNTGPKNPPKVAEVTADRALRVNQTGVSPIALPVELDSPAEIAGYSTIGDGTTSVTTAGTAVQVSSTSTACKKIMIQALQSNSGRIAVGGSTVEESTNRGMILNGGDKIELMANNLNKVYIDASVSGESISYVYFN